MRRWLIMGGLAAAAALVAAVVVYRLSTALAQNRDWVQARLETAIGRPVRFDRLDVSLWAGPGVRLTALRVADDPRFSDGDLLRAEAVEFTVRLLPALRGRWEVRRVVLERPEVTLIRTTAGLNVESFGGAGGASSGRPPSEPGGPLGSAGLPGGIVREAAAATGPEEAAPVPPLLDATRAVTVDRLALHDGVVRWIDRTTVPPGELTLSAVEVDASHLGLASPMHVDVRAALPADDHAGGTLHAAGTIGPLGEPPALAVLPLDLTASVNGLPADRVRRALGTSRTWPGGETLQLGGRARVHGTLASLDVDGRVTAGALAVDARGTVIPRLPVDADLAIDVPPVALADLGTLVPVLRARGVAGRVESHLRLRGTMALDAPPTVAGTVTLTEAAFGAAGPAGITTTIHVAGDVVDLPPTRMEIGDAALQVDARLRREGHDVVAEAVHVVAFGGTVEATGRVELGEPTRPRVAASGAARGLVLSKLAAARSADAAERIDGRADADFALTAAGSAPDELRRSLGGAIHATATKVVVRGFNAVESVLRGVTGGVHGLGDLLSPRLRARRPELFGAGATRIDVVRAQARLAGPLARVDELTATAPGWSMRAHGTVEQDGPVDLQGTFTASPELTADILATVKEARWVLDDEGMLRVPFRMVGTPPDVRTIPDPGFVTRALQRALLDRGRDLGTGRPGRRAEELIREGLDRLLGR